MVSLLVGLLLTISLKTIKLHLLGPWLTQHQRQKHQQWRPQLSYHHEYGLSGVSDGSGTIQGHSQPEVALADIMPRSNNNNRRASLSLTTTDGAWRQQWLSLLILRANTCPWLPHFYENTDKQKSTLLNIHPLGQGGKGLELPQMLKRNSGRNM